MSVSFHVKASDGPTREGRLATCARVLQSLHSFLPTVCEPTVLCLIDNMDFDWAKQQHGQANKGFFVAPVKGKGLAGIVPPYFWDLIAPPDPQTCEISYPYDSLIYIHGSTCRTDVGLVLSLAHELCHFIQYAQQRGTWAANKLLAELGPPHVKIWSDLPIEMEARYFAKRVAQEVCGTQSVQAYLLEKQTESRGEEGAEDWDLILGISTATLYSAVEPTKVLVERHRPQLEAIREKQHWIDHPDVSRLNLDTVELTSATKSTNEDLHEEPRRANARQDKP